MSLLNSASLVVTPNAVKEGTLYSVIPNTTLGDMTVVRATTATRVNSAGLIELVPYNLIRYSEQFDNAAWTKANVTISANATTSPDGTANADFIVEDSTASTQHRVSISVSTTNSIHTLSVFIKQGTGTRNAYIDIGTTYCYYNFSTGVITVIGGTAIAENYGGGWYRLIMTSTSAVTPATVYIGLANGNNETYSGNGTSSIAFWGAQLVEGSTAKDYLRTETRLNIPRLDYSNGTCPSILVEPQRSNLSNFIESGTGNFNAATVTSATSILGLTTFNVVSDGILYGDSPYINTNLEFQANSTYTCSFYTDFTHCTGTTISCTLLGFFPTVAFAVIDINKTTKAITSNNVGGVWTINSSSATQINGEIYRISFTATPNTTSLGGSRSYINGNLAGRFAGVQVEIGSYPTSFINKPTSASVTRNADVISKTGISALIGQTEGTVFIDFVWNQLTGTGSYPRIIELGNNSNNYIQSYSIAGTTSWGWDIYNGGVVQFSGSSTMALGHNKIAIGYKLNDMVIYKNGTLIASDATCTVPATNGLGICGIFDGTAGAQLSASVNSAILFPTRLTNAELAQLTTI